MIKRVLTALLCLSSFSLVAQIKPPPQTEVEAATFAKWQQAYRLHQAKLSKSKADLQAPKYLNGLILQQSPYLIRHGTNPVNWQAWSDKIFTQAKQQNKLIFLSIGYSTCHWCHVMERQSFVDEGIASILNREFIAVKVDREVNPAIDELYTNALAAVTGSAGWPVTALLNHQGEPVFIQSFLSKDKLNNLLPRIANLWQTNAEYLNLTAANVMQLVATQPKVEKIDWNKQQLTDTTGKVLALLDPVEGGFQGAQKFPSEAMLLFLLDRYQRAPEPVLAKAIRLALDNMANKGLFDAVHGGFHRYSTDSRWLVPHYEKMLYNQAQLLIVYARAAEIFPDADYEAVLRKTIDYLDLWLYQRGEGLYSAVDADYQGKEGRYYLRTAQELEALAAQDILLSKMNRYVVPDSPLFGIYFSNPETPQAHRIRRVLSKQREYRPHIDEKVITAWNGLAVWGLAEAYEVLGNEEVKAFAIDIAQALWSQHYQTKTQSLIRASYHGKASGEGTLADYAYTAMALVKLFDISGDKVWLDKAQLLSNLAQSYFVLDDHGFGLTRVNAEPLAALKMVKTSDAELLAPSTVMVEVLEALWLRTGELEFKQQRKAALNYLKSRFIQDPLNHLYAGFVIASSDDGSRNGMQYFANSKGKLQLYSEQSCELPMRLSVKLAEGWHVNADKVLQSHLRPTHIQGQGISVKYPPAKKVKLGFQQQPLSVFEGQFDILIQRNKATQSQLLKAQLQACSDKVCLMPQKLTFYLPSCSKGLVN